MQVKKKVLLLVTGMTPQIITETVWALACDSKLDEPWVPDEIQVVTTAYGLDQIQARILNEGNLQKLIDEYELPEIKFDRSCIYTIKDLSGRVLEDLKTPEDNAQAGDVIVERVKEITSCKNTELHVSIAGGRKTMGFYAGYALSLYGRAQDSMSHVLVSEKYEFIQDFYYPSKAENLVRDRDGRVWDASKAEVWLAEIPFVRLSSAIKDKHQLKGEHSFSRVVEFYNESLNDLTLKVYPDQKKIVVNDRLEVVDLAPRLLAFLHLFALDKKKGGEGFRAPTLKATQKNPNKPKELDYISELTGKFAEIYHEFYSAGETDVLVDKTLFGDVKTRLEDRLIEELGMEVAAKLALVQETRGKPFKLSIPAESIEIITTI